MTTLPAIDLQRAVCLFYQVEPAALFSTSRKRRVVVARHVGMYLARRGGRSYPQVAAMFCRTDHTSALFAVRKVEATPELIEQAEIILASLSGRTGWRGRLGRELKAAVAFGESLPQFFERVAA